MLLIHEKERSHKDFEDPIAELKNEGLALHLQSLGYAVFSFDLRGHGANAPSRSPRATGTTYRTTFKRLIYFCSIVTTGAN